MNIDEMPAGREMDALIATNVLKLKLCSANEAVALSNAAFPNRPPWDSWYVGDFYILEDPIHSTGLRSLPYYSTDPNDTQLLIDKLEGNHSILLWSESPRDWCRWRCYIDHRDHDTAYGETLQLVFCRALLQAATNPHFLIDQPFPPAKGVHP
jgi:hypothetical protein